MYCIKFVILLFFGFNCYSQLNNDSIIDKSSSVSAALDNSLSLMMNGPKNLQFNFNFLGNNTIIFKKIDLNVSTNYGVRYSSSLGASELIQKENLTLNFNVKNNIFVVHQYVYSFLRQINNDNYYGVGYGFNHYGKYSKTSLSYAIIYEMIDYSIDSSYSLFRHSFRFKTSLDKKKVSYNFDYFLQPSVVMLSDFVIYGVNKISFRIDGNTSFTIQDILSFRNLETTKLINNLSIGINHKFSFKK